MLAAVIERCIDVFNYTIEYGYGILFFILFLYGLCLGPIKREDNNPNYDNDEDDIIIPFFIWRSHKYDE